MLLTLRCFTASDLAQYITGAVLPVDGAYPSPENAILMPAGSIRIYRLDQCKETAPSITA